MEFRGLKTLPRSSTLARLSLGKPTWSSTISPCKIIGKLVTILCNENTTKAFGATFQSWISVDVPSSPTPGAWVKESRHFLSPDSVMRFTGCCSCVLL